MANKHYRTIMTDPIPFFGGSYRRIGKTMEIFTNRHWSDPGSVENYLPSGFEYKINTLTYFDTASSTVGIEVEVKGWNNVVQFSALKEDTHNYSISGSFTINTPGTYKIGDQEITLNSGTMSIKLDKSNVKEDGTITVPIKKISN